MHEQGPSFPPTWRGRPGGMLDADVPVWHRFLDAHGASYDRFYYNVRITLDDLRAKFPDAALYNIAAALLPKRIDAVGETPAAITLFEVAAVTGLRSIGQLVTYRELWRKEHPDERRAVRVALVTERIGADERAAAVVIGAQIFDLAS